TTSVSASANWIRFVVNSEIGRDLRSGATNSGRYLKSDMLRLGTETAPLKVAQQAIAAGSGRYATQENRGGEFTKLAIESEGRAVGLLANWESTGARNIQ